MIPKTIMHLLSGGMDSTVMLYDLQAQGHNVHCLLFNYHQKHVQELEFAKYHCHRLGVLFTTMEVQQLRGSELTDGSGSVVVPFRNAVLMSLAIHHAIVAGADTVTFAANKDDEAVFADCRMAFVQAMNHLNTMLEVQVEVCAPYIDKSKAWICALGNQLKVPIDQTWSCYRGGKEPCGVCPACVKRNEAIKQQ